MLNLEKVDGEVREWILGRPPKIQEMIRKWPPGKYRVKDGAPYLVTAAGSIVAVLSYDEGGEVRIGVVEPSAAAEAGAALQRLNHGRGPTTAKGISAMVDPRWLELVEVHEAVANAWEAKEADGK